MTFSIVVREGEAFGVAVASFFPAVGSVVPEVRLGVGAVATQAMARFAYRAELLDGLGRGGSAEDALRVAVDGDPRREHRQIGVVGTTDQATWTGPDCIPWAGGLSGSTPAGGYAIQGNILVGPAVVHAMEAAWLADPSRPVAERLVAAVLAGDAEGGDSRGRQGAALVAVEPGAGYDACGVLADLRVDDHPAAPQELARLLTVHDLVFGTPEDVEPLEGDLGREVSGRLAGLGYADTSPGAALAAWAGAVNYENRLSDNGIDAKVLAALRAATGG